MKTNSLKRRSLQLLLGGLIISVVGLLLALEYTVHTGNAVTHVDYPLTRNILSPIIEPANHDVHFRFIESYPDSNAAAIATEPVANYDNVLVEEFPSEKSDTILIKDAPTNGPGVLINKNESSTKPPKPSHATRPPKTTTTNVYEPETQQEFLARMETRMEMRRKHLQQTCEWLGMVPDNKTFTLWKTGIPEPRPWVYLSKKYKFLYSEIPKSGCSNWKMILMVLEGIINATSLNNPEMKIDPHGAAGLKAAKFRGLTSDEKTLYENATKLIVVREPMERLVSAYLDKVAKKPATNNSVFGKFSWEVVKKYGDRWKDPTLTSARNGYREVKACETEAAELRCNGDNNVIRISSATYGRMDNETCGSESEKNWDGTPCYSKYAYFVTSQLCDGKRSCDVIASPGQFGMVSDCPLAKKLLTVVYLCVSTKDSNIVTVCSGDAYRIKCPPGGLITIAKAFYGRTNAKTCSFKAVTINRDCEASTATSAVMSACHHRSFCDVTAEWEWIQSNPCPATTKYLQVWYNCISKNWAERSDDLHKVSLWNRNHQPSLQPQVLYDALHSNDEVVRKSLAHINVNVQSSDPESSISIPLIYKPPKYIYRKFNLSATFREFVTYILDPSNFDVTKDVINHGSPTMKSTSVRHWQSYHSLTYPCHIDYNVIAHMETIEDDARYLLHLIGAPPGLKYPQGYNKDSGKSKTTKDRVKDLFSSISDEEIKKLLKLYEIDYQLFGYEYPDLR